MIEGSLNRGLVGGGVGRPRHVDAREGFGDEEAVPGAELPRPVGMNVEGAYSSANEFGQLNDARLSNLSRTARTISSDGTVVVSEVGALQVAKACGAVARAGAAHGDEAEAFDGAGDELAVEAAADENVDSTVAEAPGGGEKAAVPEGVDGGRWRLVSRDGTRVADIPIAKSNAKEGDRHARQTGDDSEGDALLQGVGVGH